MNYRHHFHAGGAADVFKHLVLALLVRRLQHKPTPICCVDTHAGAGAYDLAHEMARKTGEYARGVARLWAAHDLPPALADLLAVIADLQPTADPPAAASAGSQPTAHATAKPTAAASADPRPPPTRPRSRPPLRVYPGSPRLVRALLRPGDRLIACELHPQDVQRLQAEFRGDPQVAVHHRDGYEALGALLPPTPRRGLTLIDPPYERGDEFSAALAGLQVAHARWPTGCHALWYPIKGPVATARLHAALQRSGVRRILCAELHTRDHHDPDTLTGSGMIVVNPPWQVDATLRETLPALASRLADDADGPRARPGHAARVEWLVGE